MDLAKSFLILQINKFFVLNANEGNQSHIFH